MNNKSVYLIIFAMLSMPACSEMTYHVDPDDCGNGRIDLEEICDDGNKTSGDGCSDTCKVEEGWTCSATVSAPSICTFNCGNGKIDFGEQCDLGVDNGTHKGCSEDCQTEEGWSCRNASGVSNCDLNCGNNKLDFGERCDLGTDNGTHKGCSEDCQIEEGWTCNNNETETISCAYKCGNGTVDDGETCDDGNREPGDGCSSGCQIESGYSCVNEENAPGVCTLNCGNGTVDDGETCDDGSRESGDGCSDKCQVETGYSCVNEIDKPSVCVPSCGNGKLDPGETCDDNNIDNKDGCSETCQTEDGYSCETDDEPSICTKLCGNNELDPGEDCDWGERNGQNEGCSAECVAEDDYRCELNYCVLKRCNDGILDDDEACDDGNALPGDGCDPNCHVEPLYECIHNHCKPKCGDGVKLPGEPCDDGNTKDGDGCSSTCQIEEGYTCTLISDVVNNTINSVWDIIPVEAIQRDFLSYQDPHSITFTEPDKIAERIEGFSEECKKNEKCHFSKDRPNHPDFNCTTTEDGNGMLREELDKKHKPVLSDNKKNVLCKESFNMWFNKDDDFNKESKQYLLFVKTGSIYKYSTLDYYIENNLRYNIYTSYITDRYPSAIRNCDNNNYYPMNDRGFYQNINDNNDAFTTELTGYIQLGKSKADYENNSDDDSWVFVNDRLILDYGGIHSPNNTHKINLKDSMEPITKIDQMGNDITVRYNKLIDGFEGGIYPIKVFFVDRGGGSNLHVVIPDLINLGKSKCTYNKTSDND